MADIGLIFICIYITKQAAINHLATLANLYHSSVPLHHYHPPIYIEVNANYAKTVQAQTRCYGFLHILRRANFETKRGKLYSSVQIQMTSCMPSSRPKTLLRHKEPWPPSRNRTIIHLCCSFFLLKADPSSALWTGTWVCFM